MKILQKSTINWSLICEENCTTILFFTQSVCKISAEFQLIFEINYNFFWISFSKYRIQFSVHHGKSPKWNLDSSCINHFNSISNHKMFTNSLWIKLEIKFMNCIHLPSPSASRIIQEFRPESPYDFWISSWEVDE